MAHTRQKINHARILAKLQKGKKLTKAEAGHLGGLKNYQNNGSEHMRKIGKDGAATTWSKYELRTVDMTDFAMVRKDTLEIVAYQSGRQVRPGLIWTHDQQITREIPW